MINLPIACAERSHFERPWNAGLCYSVFPISSHAPGTASLVGFWCGGIAAKPLP